MAFPLIDRLRALAEESPIAPALISVDACVSYGELFDTIVKVANHFDNLRLPKLAKAFVNVAHPDLRLIIFLAAIEYGLIPLIAHPDTLREDFEWDLAIGGSDPIWPDVRSDVMIDHSVLAGPLADARRRTFPERADNDLSYVAETSGTTGRPKLVAVVHKSHRDYFESVARRRFSRSSRITSSTGSANKYGIRLSCAALYDGATMVTVVIDVAAALKLINLFSATYLLTTPVYIERALDLMDMRGVRCPSLKEIQLTGSTFDPDILGRIERRFDAQIVVAYGTSEVEGGGIARGPTTAATYVKGYVGRINPELKMIVTGTKAKPGPIVLVNDSDQFTRSIVKGKIIRFDQPFYTVPDIGYVEDSVLYISGRSDEVFNNSGNIKAYGLMADEAKRLGGLKDVAIVSAASLGNDKDIIIGIVADRPIDLDGLAALLAQRLLMSGAEKHFKLCQVGEIKRNQESGKVDRVALIRSYQMQNPNPPSQITKTDGEVTERSRGRG